MRADLHRLCLRSLIISLETLGQIVSWNTFVIPTLEPPYLLALAENPTQ